MPFKPTTETTPETKATPKSPEIQAETTPESRVKTVAKIEHASAQKEHSTPAQQERTSVVAAAIPKDELQKNIESILEDNLGETFGDLQPLQQQAFKMKGEEVSWKTRHMLEQTKVKLKELWELILGWLKMLPGLNQFFVEQEAKIKVDRLLGLRQS